MVTFKSTKMIKFIDKALMPPVDPYIKQVFKSKKIGCSVNDKCSLLRLRDWLGGYLLGKPYRILVLHISKHHLEPLKIHFRQLDLFTFRQFS